MDLKKPSFTHNFEGVVDDKMDSRFNQGIRSN